MEDMLVNTLYTVGKIVFIYVTIVFCLAQLLRDNGFMDIAYGPAFTVSLGLTAVSTLAFETVPVLIITCVTLWATRLSLRIFINHRGKPEDPRYAKWREAWTQKGKLYFYLRSYLQINILQGFIILLIAMPGIIAITTPSALPLPFVALGTLVFLFGLSYETIADIQLDRFIARKRAGKETAVLMTKDLFKYSRRPNYFGETLVWWGLAIMVLPLPFGWVALISPLLITYIVTKVTGPMLENIFLEKYPEEYHTYMETTPYLVPRFHLTK